MKHLWSIICGRAIINNETKTISLIDVLEELTFYNMTESSEGKTKVAFPCDFEVVSYWVRDDANREKYVDFSLEIIDPNNEKIGESNNKMSFPQDSQKRMRTIIKSRAFVFTVDGIYLFKIKMNEGSTYRTVAEFPIDVRLRKTEVK